MGVNQTLSWPPHPKTRLANDSGREIRRKAKLALNKEVALTSGQRKPPPLVRNRELDEHLDRIQSGGHRALLNRKTLSDNVLPLQTKTLIITLPQ